MKRSLLTTVIALALAPAAAMAQTQGPDSPVTRAQVMNQLIQLRQNGYVPSKIHYPADIQAAEARVGTQAGVSTTAVSDMGGATAGTVQSGSPVMTPSTSWRSMYGRH
ncbi:DUF4148 domain-containing protein [Trinickia soli]|uniref:DUF4148 domain-containing protein n=1 Tax=Trinickia soli TaxID=380675 RepID=A0A2N7WGP3_9BURK|nr:DUF4148 domain-containing protein [Trinickia soli]PMS28524.1 hypothetical protein C0Z19_02180 [Trinickia soli]CAB3672148.1 hypothetical protein LMG24076_02004 [Trinickia soli]